MNTRPHTKAEWILYRETPRWKRAPFTVIRKHVRGKEVFVVADRNGARWLHRTKRVTAEAWVERWNEEAATMLMSQ